MIFPLALIVPIAVSACLYLWFKKLESGRTYWITAATAAAIVALARIVLLTLGVYFLEHTSGWLQLPGYAMALCGLPEWTLMPRPTGGTMQVVPRLAAVLVVGSAGWVFAIAGLAARVKQPSRRDGRRQRM